MIFFGARLSLSRLPHVLSTIIALFEFLIILRVIIRLIFRLTKTQEGPVSGFLTAVTEPALRPFRGLLSPVASATGIDFSPAAAILACELLNWLIGVVF